MSEHTPGPWSVTWIAGALRHINRNVDNEDFWFPTEEERANLDSFNWPQKEDATLVAAAPDLLAALEQAPNPRIWSHPTASDLETMLAIREWAAIYFEWYRSVRAAALVKARKA